MYRKVNMYPALSHIKSYVDGSRRKHFVEMPAQKQQQQQLRQQQQHEQQQLATGNNAEQQQCGATTIAS